jgi:hypothetical protein
MIQKILNVQRSVARSVKDSMVESETDMKISDAMEVINYLLQGHGIEAIRGSEWHSHYWQDTAILYVNRGDTYTPTIVYDVEKERFECTSWGAWVESAQSHGKFRGP